MLRERQDLQRAAFIAAAEGLRLARQNGVEATGYTALNAVYGLRFRRHLPPFYKAPDIQHSPEAEVYFKNLGAFVELAAELEPRVDQQG